MRPSTSPALSFVFSGVLIAGLGALAGCTADGRDLFGAQASGGGEGGAGGTGNASASSTSASSSSASSVGASSSSSASSSASVSSSSSSVASSSSSGGGGLCAHAACVTGDKLEPGCDACVDKICEADPFCCNDKWDSQCVQEVAQHCGVSCCGDGQCNGENCTSCPTDCGACMCGDGKCDGETCATCKEDCGVCNDCPHSVCAAGSALSTMLCRDACVDQTCAQDMTCCSSQQPNWNASCQILATSLCDGDPCIAAVCAGSPDCCKTGWTQACVDAAKQKCGTGCDCAHSICEDGEKLDPGCNPCVASVCKADPYCCNTGWDGTCRGEVGSVCGIKCN